MIGTHVSHISFLVTADPTNMISYVMVHDLGDLIQSFSKAVNFITLLYVYMNFMYVHNYMYTGILDDAVPQVLINREPLKHMTFDVELLGDCDVIIAELCRRLGSDWLEGIGLSPNHKPAGSKNV